MVDDLLYGGLTRAEHGNEQRRRKARAAWEQLTEDERQERLANLKPLPRG